MAGAAIKIKNAVLVTQACFLEENAVPVAEEDAQRHMFLLPL